MGKLAIDYSDGIVLASADVNQNLVTHAQEKNVPVLDFKEDFADAYEEFYNQICPEE
jgi:starch synthase